MKHKEEALTSLTNLWISLVGDSKGFEGDTVEDKRILISLMGKTSFAWTEYETLAQEANGHDYGVSIIIFDKADWKESYLRGNKTRTKDRNFKLRRKAA